MQFYVVQYLITEEGGSTLSTIKMNIVNSWLMAATVMCVWCNSVTSSFCLEYAYLASAKFATSVIVFHPDFAQKINPFYSTKYINLILTQSMIYHLMVLYWS